MWVSAIQQSGSTVHICILFHCGWSQDVERGALCCVRPCLSVLYVVACIPQSQTPNPPLPHLFSPRATPRPFSVSEPLSVSLVFICVMFYTPHVSDVVRCLSIFLTSLSMITSRFIHVAANGIILRLSNIPLYICTTSSIHSSVDGHLGCFRIMGVVHSAAVNVGVHVSFRITVLCGYMSTQIIWQPHF